jgi:hypothetical protein
MDRLWDTLQGQMGQISQSDKTKNVPRSEFGSDLPGVAQRSTGKDMHRSKSENTEEIYNGSSYADKFMERIISMAIPTTTTSSKRELDRILGRIEMQRSRPQLSMQIMSKNSILLLQRLSIPFEIIDMLTNFVNWKNPMITITIMLFLSLCILKPINFLTVPIFYICFEIIIPAYTIQNPNILEDDEINHINVNEEFESELPKPVNEFSREFLLNVTDLQNHMLLYVKSWDFIISWCWKLFYFRDEMLSWFIFVFLLSNGIILELFGPSFIIKCFPIIKLLIVVISWIIIVSLHPKNRVQILSNFYSEELRLKTMSLLNHYESKIIKDLDLTIDKMEIKQIEIFELQYFNEELKVWQFVCFSKDNYPLNSHIRLNNLPIEGTSSLNSIIPPNGWKFVNISNDDVIDENDVDNNINININNNTTPNKITSTNNFIDSKRLILDSEKKKILAEKRKHQKLTKKQQKRQHKHRTTQSELYIKRTTESDNELNIQRRRESNDFNNVLIDPLILNKQLIEQLETGVNYEGWSLDLCPSEWVNNNYLQDVFEIDNETKWVYDLVIMGNGINAYSAGLGLIKGKVKKGRGDIRRRRWVRYVVKEIVKGFNTPDVVITADESDQDIYTNDNREIQEDEEDDEYEEDAEEEEDDNDDENDHGDDDMEKIRDIDGS